MTKKIIFFLIAALLPSMLIAQLSEQYGAKVLSNSVVVKFFDTTALRGINHQLNQQEKSLLAFIGATQIKQKYPNATQSSKKDAVDLRKIYEISYRMPYSVQMVSKWFMSLDNVEYAHPHYIPQHFASVNDPMAAQQYYLNTIQAYSAWDIETGDSTVVVGVVDSGVDMGHEELLDQIAYNREDPINGVDDDNDGYTDNFRGWDLSDEDNNPTTNTEDHGTTVAGPLIARANNNKFIAGIAQTCRFLPVKETDSLGNLTRGYEALVYAADHGCSIINCSWGSTFNTKEGEDVVRYATINKGALVIAAAGNSNNSSIYYPASTPLCMSVAATTETDQRWSPLNTPTQGGSSYNYMVDISAPGALIWTIAKPNTSFKVWGGTSIASPIVSAVAALVKSNRKHLTMEQVRAQLEVTAKNIDTIPFNATTANMLGRGRVDAYNSLNDTLKPAIRFENYSFSDGLDNGLLPQRTISFTGRFRNLLAPSGKCTVRLRSLSPFMQISKGTIVIDTLTSAAVLTNQEFQFSLSTETPLYYTLNFKLEYEYANHTDQQIFTIQVNNQFITLSTPSLQLSVSATGRCGYVTSDKKGIGLLFNQKRILSTAGLLLAESPDSVISCAFNQQDFMPVQPASAVSGTLPWASATVSSYNDAFDNSNRMNLSVDQKVSTLTGVDAFILQYTIKNNSATTLKNFIVGQYADWDINMEWYNKTEYDNNNRMSYTWSPLFQTCYGGLTLLDGSMLAHHCVDYSVTDSLINVNDDFTDAEQYEMLKRWQNSGGNKSEVGSGLFDCMSSGPYTLKSNDSLNVTFALCVASNLDSLRRIAQHLHKVIPSKTALNQEATDTFSVSVDKSSEESKTFSLHGTYEGTLEYSIFSMDGRTIEQNSIEKQQPDQQYQIVKKLSKGMYQIIVKNRQQQQTKAFIVL